MRKNLTIFCVLVLSLLLAGSVFAQNNLNGYIALDKNLATAGYQAGTPMQVTGIGASSRVGFTVYAFGLDNARTLRVKFDWDATKATIRTSSIGPSIQDLDAATINGASVTPPNEANMLGDLIALPTSGTGTYETSLAKTGPTPATSPAAGGLVFYAVFTTAATFTTETQLTIQATVTVGDDSAVEKTLFTTYFNVNPVAVKNATWGDVKSQFKDF